MPLMMKQTILLLALAAPIIKADVNHDFQARCPGVSNERGGCYSAGFVDKIQSAEDCQANHYLWTGQGNFVRHRSAAARRGGARRRQERRRHGHATLLLRCGAAVLPL